MYQQPNQYYPQQQQSQWNQQQQFQQPQQQMQYQQPQIVYQQQQPTFDQVDMKQASDIFSLQQQIAAMKSKLWSKTQSSQVIQIPKPSGQFKTISDFTTEIFIPMEGNLVISLNSIVKGKGYLRLAFWIDDESLSQRKADSDKISPYGECHIPDTEGKVWPLNYTQMVNISPGKHVITVRAWPDSDYESHLGEIKCLYHP